jgi:hypothetical protein
VRVRDDVAAIVVDDPRPEALAGLDLHDLRRDTVDDVHELGLHG